MCSSKCRLLLARLHRCHFSTVPASNHRKGNPQITIRWPEQSIPSPDPGDTARDHEATVRRLAAAGDVDGVQYALQEMRLRGVACPEGALVAAICAFARAGAPDRALKTFYRAHDLGCAAPTVLVYNHLLDALIRENLVGAVVPVYESMRKALCQNDRVDAARKMLDEMATKGCHPDEALWRVQDGGGVLGCPRDGAKGIAARPCHLHKKAMLDQSENLIDKMSLENCPPNT